MNKKEKFIYKATEKFNNQYDYSKVVYTNSTTKIEIRCIKHNILFKQVPSEHLRGKKACKSCNTITKEVKEKLPKNKPNYWYIIGKNRKHRFGFRKTILKKEGFDIENKTEHEVMLERKIYRIYDCGTVAYQLFLK